MLKLIRIGEAKRAYKIGCGMTCSDENLDSRGLLEIAQAQLASCEKEHEGWVSPETFADLASKAYLSRILASQHTQDRLKELGWKSPQEVDGIKNVARIQGYNERELEVNVRLEQIKREARQEVLNWFTGHKFIGAGWSWSVDEDALNEQIKVWDIEGK